MPNSYFQFKEFTIQQESCAMKVCTDACLFGASVASEIINNKITISNCLDIGTGTGLLSLMMAQKVNADFDAVEIDTAAYLQAKENFQQSPWNERLAIFNTDILQFDTDEKYDCIITNPPFFEGGLKSDINNKNIAKHSIALTLHQLLDVIAKHLNDDGFFAVLLPWQRINYCIEQAEKAGLYCSKKIMVKQTPAHNYFRGILFFNREKTFTQPEEINVKDENGKYSTAFTKLLQDYYLYL